MKFVPGTRLRLTPGPVIKTQNLLLDEKEYHFERPTSWCIDNIGWHFFIPYAHICPHCLTVWLKASLNEEESKYQIIPRPCKLHGDGQILQDFSGYYHDPFYFYILPTELLKRELLLLIELKQREIKDENNAIDLPPS